MLRRGSKLTKPWHGTRVHQLALTASLILIFLLILLILKNNGKPHTSFGPPSLKWNSFRSSVQFQPTLEFMNETDVIWQIPDSPKAVIFLAHGCNGKAANFWDQSQNCPNCIGLPEERLIVLNSLSRNFAVLTISSSKNCWTFGKEKEIVKGVIKLWLEKTNLHKLPLMALGASSGGYFVSALAAEMRFSSITLMIAEGLFGAIDVTTDYPPTLFVHMPKDRRRKELIVENMEFLKKQGVKVAEIKCVEFPLTPIFLSDRIPGLDQTVSVKLFELFHEKGFIDENGYMRGDGRKINWKEALRGRDILSEKSEWINHIQEEMNLAFAFHEMTSLETDQILNWFESNMS